MIKKVWKVPGARVPPPNERTLKVLASPEVTKTENLTLLLSLISPGSTTGSHTHDVDEFMYMVSGRGEGTVEGEVFPLTPDVLLFAPAGAGHEIKNTGDETLKIFCVFTPPLKPTGYIAKAVEAAKKGGEDVG
ncbi:MAG: cupin domain-containing protein [Candidatus Bathyarchaeia archaeon]